LKLPSKSSGSTEKTEKEGDTASARDLADDLRDAIFEYQVCSWIERRTLDSLIMYIVLAAEGDLQTNEHIDCEFQDKFSKRTVNIDCVS